MILYFSSTGNCKYTAEKIAEALGDTAQSIIGLDPDITLHDGECLGFVAPTYWWEIALPMRRFMEQLSAKNCGYVFYVSTYGGVSGCCGTEAKAVLKKRGISLCAAFGIKMPDNYTPMFDLSDPQDVTEILSEAEKALDKVIGQIKSQARGNHTPARSPYAFHPFTDYFYNKQRKTSNFTLEESCIGCGLCEKLCPEKAIQLRDGKPVWIKESCAICLGCLHHCPKFAIQFGGKTKEHGQYLNPNTEI